MRTVILGCGPSGLVAARAVVDAGGEAIIISNTDKPSKQYGCQYLHAPIPGYEDVPSVPVHYILRGSPEGYRRKVYGEEWEGKVSPEDFVGEHTAWDIRETYTRLWADLIAGLQVGLIQKRVVRGMIPYLRSLKPDLIVSTIPAQALCEDPRHEFRTMSIYANGATASQVYLNNVDTIICDGTHNQEWYRMSNVFGYLTTEWPGTWRPPSWVKAVPVIKPLSTTCNCHSEVLRVGRYGTWTKATLVHEVYPAVLAALDKQERLIRGIERVTGETYLGEGEWRK